MSLYLEQLARNPFAQDPGAWTAALAFAAEANVHRSVMETLESSGIEDAERVLLGLSHGAALRGLPPELELADRVWKKLPRPPEAYWRIVQGARRCHRALRRLVGSSAALERVRAETWAACFGESLHHALTLERVIMDHDVLVTGETGTGKELIAHAIQEALPSDAPEGAPRAALNAAAVPHGLIESELFGHQKGAFTGATADRRGQIRSARGGCFFLDEVGDLPTETQVKLLRVMETDLVTPLGTDTPFEADVRYVAATHKDLEAMVIEGAFRRDLYQRLAGHVIRLPPLRERREDIPALGRSFLDLYVAPGALPAVRERTERWLEEVSHRALPWTGNVRELFNLLRSVMLGFEPELSERVVLDPSVPPRPIQEGSATLREVDDWYIGRVLAHTGGNYAAAARILGMDRATVRRRAARLTE